jgi:lipoprotein NlpI
MRLTIALLLTLLAWSGPAWAQWTEDAQKCFELTKPESMKPDQALPICSRVIESGKLINRNLATIYYYRGNIYSIKRDYKRAIPDYDQAIRLDPTYAQIHNARGFARFFLGQLPEAATDFEHAVNVRPEDLYALLWRYFIETRNGNDGRTKLESAVKQLTLDAWPAPVISLYLGELSPKALLDTATDSNANKQREKKCEAYFYIGQQLLIQGKKNEAVKIFRAAVATNAIDIVEHEGAKVELKRLGS